LGASSSAPPPGASPEVRVKDWSEALARHCQAVLQHEVGDSETRIVEFRTCIAAGIQRFLDSLDTPGKKAEALGLFDKYFNDEYFSIAGRAARDYHALRRLPILPRGGKRKRRTMHRKRFHKKIAPEEIAECANNVGSHYKYFLKNISRII